MKTLASLLKNIKLRSSPTRLCLPYNTKTVGVINSKGLLFKFKPLSTFNSSLFHPSSLTLHSYYNTTSLSSNHTTEDHSEHQDLVIEEWEEEDDSDPQIGDGGAGGGVVLQNVPWGETVLSIAREVLLQFGDDIKLYAFKTTPRGYIYVRLDKLTNEYGCPGMEEVERYSREYKKRLEEEGSKGQIPDDLALEVSSPGAERLLMVPNDLHRFKDFPMVVWYVEEARAEEKMGVFFLESIETETEHCVWKLADVRENRDPASKGRPLNRKQRDWRLKLPYTMVKKVSLYLDF
ncbi:hypothetical protein KSS87_000939 [Heliosperma pusillum]|nr:hypothetical protein KSS87_000939 [Heliosperma pusillum]